MLSKDPGAARLVRFAPESARGAASRDPLGDGRWDTAGNDVVWTLTGRFAGVLRLVPLSGGAVRTSGVPAEPSMKSFRNSENCEVRAHDPCRRARCRAVFYTPAGENSSELPPADEPELKFPLATR